MTFSKNKIEHLVRLAQSEASQAAHDGNPPFGAVMIDRGGNVVVAAHNTSNSSLDPTGHAEINLLRKAAKKLGKRHFDSYIVVTNAMSCSMCASACIKAGITTFYYGAPPEKTMSPFVTISDLARKSKKKIAIYPGVLEKECVDQIRKLRGRSVKFAKL